MAESAEDPALYWIEPQQRGILPLDQVHVPRRLARTIRQGVFEVKIDTDFDGVIEGCAASRAGPAHPPGSTDASARSTATCSTSATATRSRCGATGDLVGGLYGVALDGAFFGESMFSNERDACKIALVYLAARLDHGGFRCSTRSS